MADQEGTGRAGGGPAGSEEAMVSLQDFIRSHGGPKVLSLLDGMAKALNPNSISQEDLEQNALEAPSGTPDNLLPADKLGPFLSDAYNLSGCTCAAPLSTSSASSRLHLVEQRCLLHL